MFFVYGIRLYFNDKVIKLAFVIYKQPIVIILTAILYGFKFFYTIIAHYVTKVLNCGTNLASNYKPNKYFSLKV